MSSDTSLTLSGCTRNELYSEVTENCFRLFLECLKTELGKMLSNLIQASPSLERRSLAWPRSLPTKIRLQKNYFLKTYSSLPSWSENCLFLIVTYTHWIYWRYYQFKALLTQTYVIHTYIYLCVYTCVYTYPLSRAAQILMSLFTSPVSHLQHTHQ